MLCITSGFINRQDFFKRFCEYLKKTNVKKLTVIENAYVPLIKFSISGVDVDLLYAQLQINGINSKNFNILDDKILQNLDEKSILSVSGPRVSDKILKLIPDTNIFKHVLKIIKIWAKRRVIYSNVLGFFGGISWSILVAKICQIYPRFNISSIIIRFFHFCTIWNFNWSHPIKLCSIEKNELGYIVWDPSTNYRDSYDLIPIITPAYPSINSTHNVLRTTLRILKKEFKRGSKILNLGTRNKEITTKVWKKLLKENTFFQDHKHFIQITIFSRLNKFYLLWKGFIQTRIRIFLHNLEEFNGIIPFPNPKAFHPYNWTKIKEYNECFWFIGLNIIKKMKYNLTKIVQKFLIQIYQNKLTFNGCTIYMKHLKRNDIPICIIGLKKYKKKFKRPKVNIKLNIKPIIRSLIKFIPRSLTEKYIHSKRNIV